MYIKALWFAVDWNCQWQYVLLLWTFFLCFWPARKRIGWVGATTIFYYLTSGIHVWISSFNRYMTVEPYDQQAIRFFSADAVGKLAIVVCGVVYLAKDRELFWRRGKAIAALYCLLDSLFVCAQLFLDPNYCRDINTCGGVIGNPSMNASFLAVLLPLAFDYFPGRWKALPVLSVVGAMFISKSNMGFALLVLMFVLLAIDYASARSKRAILAIIGAIAATDAAAWSLRSKFLQNGDRLPMWKFFINVWNLPHNRAFGTGFGNFGVFSLRLQHAFHMRDGNWWIWMHNDWLQSGLFEGGWVGFGLMAATYVVACSKLFLEGKRPELLSLLLLGAMMGTNYPTHLAPTATYAAWLVVLALAKEQICNRTACSYNGLEPKGEDS